MKTFEITYTYNYQTQQSKIFKAVDGLDALEALEAWVDGKSSTINDVKLQEIHLGHFSKEGRVSHTYGATIFKWKIKKGDVFNLIQTAKQNWIDAKSDDSVKRKS